MPSIIRLSPIFFIGGQNSFYFAGLGDVDDQGGLLPLSALKRQNMNSRGGHGILEVI